MRCRSCGDRLDYRTGFCARCTDPANTTKAVISDHRKNGMQKYEKRFVVVFLFNFALFVIFGGPLRSNRFGIIEDDVSFALPILCIPLTIYYAFKALDETQRATK